MRVLNFIRKGLALLALLSYLPLYAADANALAKISAQVDQYSVVRAEFTQTKQMAAMKRPLITTGKLVFVRQHGVLWQIEQPYRISYLLSEEKIVEIGPDGIRKERSQREIPGLAQVGRVFRAMLGANTAALHEYFDVVANGNAKKWRIDLKPRQPQIGKFITSLHISGGHFVESIRIVEAEGDTTLIRFRNSHGSAKASKSDEQLFVGQPR